VAKELPVTTQYYPNGIGGYPPGDFLDTCKPLQTSGNVWYVSSLVGIDAVGPAGQNREKPLATLAQAVTNSADEDIIVFLPGHTQTLILTQPIAKRLTLLGEGVVDGKPAVSFYGNSAAQNLFSCVAPAVQFRNIYFPENKLSSTAPRILVSNADFLMRGCYVECGANDRGAALLLSGARARFESTTFISTAVLTTAQPLMAIQSGAVDITGITMEDVVVSAGKFGFSNYAAIDLSAATTIAQMKIAGLSLLLGADMVLPAAATGRVNIQTATGGSRVQWS
jgi:hypothetical protein